MHLNSSAYIVQKAEQTVKSAGSRNPQRIADALGLCVRYVPFKKQKGVYAVIERSRYIFLKEDLSSVEEGIVLLHEVGHDVLHRHEAAVFQEFSVFDRAGGRMEYEANLFAAEIMLPDEEILEYIYRGYDTAQIAACMGSDSNLVALKARELIARGYDFRGQEHRDDFLKGR